MVIKLSQILKDATGADFKDEVRNQMGVVIEDNGLLTLEKICCRSVLYDDPQEKISMQDRDIKYRLWQKMVNKTEIELKAEEITMIKQQIAKAYSTLVFGQTSDMLENKEPLKLAKNN